MSIMSSDRERRSIVQGEGIVGPVYQHAGGYQTGAIERKGLGCGIVIRILGSSVDVEVHHAVARMRETRSNLHATVSVDGIRESKLRTAVPNEIQAVTGLGVARTDVVVEIGQAIELRILPGDLQGLLPGKARPKKLGRMPDE